MAGRIEPGTTERDEGLMALIRPTSLGRSLHKKAPRILRGALGTGGTTRIFKPLLATAGWFPVAGDIFGYCRRSCVAAGY